MAEISGKGKHISPRVDLTPMVDVNLLLVTFFMFTSQLQASKAMEVAMPFNKPGHTAATTEEEVLNIYLSGSETVRYIEGDPLRPDNLPVTSSWEPEGLRSILLHKQQTLQALISKGALSARSQLTVLIRPDSNCTTAQVVRALDEMAITAVPVYMITDMHPEDYQRLNQ